MKKQWWIRPLVRLVAAILLPLLVPAVITGAMWLLPGDPAEIICPPETCTGGAELAERLRLDRGPFYFYITWLGHAFIGDFGNSWTYMAGKPVRELLMESGPTTALLVACAFVPLFVGSLLSTMGLLPRRLDGLWQAMGALPAVILALLFAAAIEINLGPFGHEWTRLVCAAIVLGVADGSLAGSIVGTRQVFKEEVKQRYAQIAILRGESMLSNTLPNVLPALVGQFRARLLHLLSGTVVVEVVLGVSGVGELLWDGTLAQDYGVVLAAAFAFALISSSLLLIQASCEVLVARHVLYSPKVVEAV